MTFDSRLTLDAARRLLYALVREWTPHVVVAKRHGFVDLDCETRPVLDMVTRHRFRLFVGPVGHAEIAPCEKRPTLRFESRSSWRWARSTWQPPADSASK